MSRIGYGLVRDESKANQTISSRRNCLCEVIKSSNPFDLISSRLSSRLRAWFQPMCDRTKGNAKTLLGSEIVAIVSSSDIKTGLRLA